MDQAIVLKNIRRDIPAMKPLAAKVILLQRQLIQAVQRYQELNSKPDKDDAAIQELLREIADINQSQREELNLVREAESNYTPQDDDGGHQEEPKDEEEEKEDVDDDDDRSLPSPYGPILGEEEDEIPEEPMDWEDLTREQWTETDKLLQKIERAGSRVIQQDFMSSVELVHVNSYKQAEEALAKRKRRMAEGKKIITTGPWQVIDIPSKVTNRRCNYLTGLHVTIRQKDPARRPASSSAPTISEGNGVKTRLHQHQDSRGSSRTSSRASSPASMDTSSNPSSNGNAGHTKVLRSNKIHPKSRPAVNKAKPKAQAPATNGTHKVNGSAPASKTTPNPALPAADKGTPTTTSTAAATTADKAGSASNKPLEPCVTYTVVDGVPHFKVFFPSKEPGKTAQQLKVPHASIVESDIEVARSGSASSSSSSSSSSGRENGHNHLHQRTASVHNSKPPPIKAIKRPRLAQSLSPSKPVSGSGSLGLSSAAAPSGNKEELGRCIEKCGSWMGAPHFKIYRTIPSVNPSSTADFRPAPTPANPPAAPKLSSPKAAGVVGVKLSSSMPPKLTMGGHPGPVGSINNNGKFVPIAPKSSPSDKTQPAGGGIKRPASLLRTCPPLFTTSSQSSSAGSPAGNTATTLLTVKNLKECLQTNVKVQHQPGDGQPMSLKKAKVVKLFPAGGDSHSQRGGDDSQQQNFSPPPTVIVADMSM